MNCLYRFFIKILLYKQQKKIGTRREISISMNLYLNIQEQIKCIENSTKIRKNGDFNRSNRKTHKNNEL